MKEVKKLLEEAFQLVSSITVKGDAVDVIAAARANLRAAYHLLDKQPDTEEEEASKEVSTDG